jgi:hypothetical protein
MARSRTDPGEQLVSSKYRSHGNERSQERCIRSNNRCAQGTPDQYKNDHIESRHFTETAFSGQTEQEKQHDINQKASEDKRPPRKSQRTQVTHEIFLAVVNGDDEGDGSILRKEDACGTHACIAVQQPHIES